MRPLPTVLFFAVSVAAPLLARGGERFIRCNQLPLRWATDSKQSAVVLSATTLPSFARWRDSSNASRDIRLDSIDHGT